MENLEIEVSVKMPFDNGEVYVVGYDTMGDGVRFDDMTYVCRTQDELDSEAYRIFDTYWDGEIDFITHEEFLVIAKLEVNFKVDYREYEVIRKRVK